MKRDYRKIILPILIIIVILTIYHSQNNDNLSTNTQKTHQNESKIIENLGNSRYLVDNWTLRYYHTNYSKPKPWYDYGPFSAIFKTPMDNMVIEFTGNQTIPESPDFMFPLTIYFGNAYNKTVPAYWSGNVTCNSNVSIVIENAGWYTVTITGDAHKDGHRYSLNSWGEERFETVLVYLSFQIKTSEGTITTFQVNNRMWEPS